MGSIKVSSEERKFYILSWLSTNYVNIPWKEAIVNTGKVLIDDLNINLVL